MAGAGCAGLSLAVQLIQSGSFSDKRILIIDKDAKTLNDRTWCFWEKSAGPFEHLVYKRWDHAWFYSNDAERRMDLSPYSYKLIRGIDFYEWCHEYLRKQPNIEFRTGVISDLRTDNNFASLKLDHETITATYIFSSILIKKPVIRKNEYYLLQHFKGRVITTKEDVFNPDEATLMDFRTDQRAGATFFYVMPFSKNKALIEYTLFTPALLEQKEYDIQLDRYIQERLGIDAYTTEEDEFGIIPMTNHRFPQKDGHIIFTGTAGGQTKASSGYTFRFIQKHSAEIVQSLQKTGTPFSAPPTHARKYRFYDSVLLHILQNRTMAADKIFTKLFNKNEPRHVLGFLDNESSLKDEIKIISSLPPWPFLKAAVRQ
jgi:lycopene beta-cyclase